MTQLQELEQLIRESEQRTDLCVASLRVISDRISEIRRELAEPNIGVMTAIRSNGTTRRYHNGLATEGYSSRGTWQSDGGSDADRNESLHSSY